MSRFKSWVVSRCRVDRASLQSDDWSRDLSWYCPVMVLYDLRTFVISVNDRCATMYDMWVVSGATGCNPWVVSGATGCNPWVVSGATGCNPWVVVRHVTTRG